MALTYITKAAEAARARNQQTAAFIQNITNNIAKEQRRKNAEADKIVQEGRKHGNDFYNEYAKQEKSGTVAWNTGASELVGRLASEQEELYSRAFSSTGTPELRNEFRVKQARDRQVLSNIGQWATLSNQNSKDMVANQDAHEQNIDLGRMTRGNDTDKYAFAQNMQNGQYSNYKFDIDEAGNVLLNASTVNTDGTVVRNDNRNLSADVANNASGNTWYSSIGEADLLEKKLGDNWLNKTNGYNTLFKPTKKTNKYYDSNSQEWKTTVEEVYDPSEIRSSLLNDYSNRLESEIRGPGFEKTWDQLWRKGFIRDGSGNPLAAGDIAWRDVQKISSMDSKEFSEFAVDMNGGDINKDGVVDDKDKFALLGNINDAAKSGLANYYSEMMAPQKNQLVSTTTQDAKGGGATGLSAKDKNKLNANRPVYQKLKTSSTNIVDLPNSTPAEIQTRASSIANDLNNDHLGEATYYSGTELYNYMETNFPDEDKNITANAVYKVVMIKNPKVGAGDDASQRTQYIPQTSPVLTEDNVASKNVNDMLRHISSAAGFDDDEQGYLRSQKIATPPKK